MVLLKGPLLSPPIEFNTDGVPDIKISDLASKLPTDIQSEKIAFVWNGLVLDSNRTLVDYKIKNTSTVFVLTKKRSESPMTISKRKATPNLPPNLNDCVKSFRVLIDHYGLPFVEKLKQMIQKEDSFNALLSTVPGLQEDVVAVKMLKDMAILKHYVKKENIAAIKEDHPALLCAISQISVQMTSDIDTLSAVHSILGSRSRSGDGEYDDDDDDDDDDYFGTDEGELMDTGDNTENNFIHSPNFPPPPSDAVGMANAAATAASTNINNPQRLLTADFLSRTLDAVLARVSNNASNNDNLGSSNVAPTPIPASAATPSAAVSSAPAPTPFTPSPESIRQLCELGIAKERAVQALTTTKGNFDQALDLLFSGQI